jgi:hypothetical protein
VSGTGPRSGEAICSRCRPKDLTKHHCQGHVQREQPKALYRCTCPCHEVNVYGQTVEQRKATNSEIAERARANAWQGCRPGYR